MWCSCHLYSAKIQKFLQTQSTSSIFFSIHLSQFLNGGFDSRQRNYTTID